MANIFFDLDGTLINSQYRLYNLFVELCPKCQMTYDEYWKIKRQRVNQKDFLKKYFNYTDKECDIFHKTWLAKVEEPKRMSQDFVVEGIDRLIRNLSENHKLYIVTNRQSKEVTVKEIENLGLIQYICDIIVTEQTKTKEQLIRENIEYSQTDILVGDTGEDIKTAKALGIKSIAVSWGVLDKNILKEYKPDNIAESVKELNMLL